MVDTAQSFITSSWTFYLQADDGKIVIFQSKPEIQYAPELEQEPTNLKDSSLSKMSYLQMRSSQAHRNYLEDGERPCNGPNPSLPLWANSRSLERKKGLGRLQAS